MSARSLSSATTSSVLEALAGGPPTMDVTPTAELLGVSRAALYDAIKNGSAPVRTIRVNNRIRVLTASVIELLGGSDHVRTGETATDHSRSEGKGMPLTG